MFYPVVCHGRFRLYEMSGWGVSMINHEEAYYFNSPEPSLAV